MDGIPAPRARTTGDIDRDLDRIRWVREQAIGRLDADAAEIASHRIDQLLEERYELQVTR